MDRFFGKFLFLDRMGVLIWPPFFAHFWSFLSYLVQSSQRAKLTKKHQFLSRKQGFWPFSNHSDQKSPQMCKFRSLATLCDKKQGQKKCQICNVRYLTLSLLGETFYFWFFSNSSSATSAKAGPVDTQPVPDMSRSQRTSSMTCVSTTQSPDHAIG